MCDPVSVGIIGGSALLSATAASKQQKAENASLEYNAKIQEYNSKVADTQARMTEERGREEANKVRLQAGQLAGSQRSSYAASGAKVDTGSVSDVLNDTRVFGELDATTVQRNADQDAWGLREQSNMSRMQANLYRTQKRSRGSAFGQSLLGSASNFGSAYAYNRAMR
jgi:hypothetical protein